MVKLTLGIDSSTQGVKAVAWDVDAEKVVFSASVNYGRDLPQYNSPDGFLDLQPSTFNLQPSTFNFQLSTFNR